MGLSEQEIHGGSSMTERKLLTYIEALLHSERGV